MAEGEGFEPPLAFRPKRFSRPPVSTTHTSLRVRDINSLAGPAKVDSRRTFAGTPCFGSFEAEQGAVALTFYSYQNWTIGRNIVDKAKGVKEDLQERGLPIAGSLRLLEIVLSAIRQ